MSKGRVQFTLVVRTREDGETVRAEIEANLLTKDIFDRPTKVIVTTGEDGSIRLSGQIRFNTRDHAQAIFDDVQAKWTAGPLATSILATSQVTIHDCPHDEPEINWVPCNTRSFLLAVK